MVQQNINLEQERQMSNLSRSSTQEKMLVPFILRNCILVCNSKHYFNPPIAWVSMPLE
jgi:hypothetical protein